MKLPSIKRVSGPDGLEAWYVAFAACMINFIFAGLGRMSGILYVEFIDIFNTDRKGAAVPFSVRSSTRNLLGPVVGILGQKYGVRAVTVAGGILGTVSAAICFYADNILWVTILWGGINGIGMALTTTLPQVVLQQHFKKYRTTASGMAFSGGCVGSFLFPVMLEHLLYTYNLSGTFLIMAGIIFHAVPAAMILKTPTWLKTEKKNKSEGSSETVYTISDTATENIDIENFPDKVIRTNDFLQNGIKASENPDVCLIDTVLLKENSRLVVDLLSRDFRSERHCLEIDRICQNYSDGGIEIQVNDLLCRIEKYKVSKSILPFEGFGKDSGMPTYAPQTVNGDVESTRNKLHLNGQQTTLLLLEKLFQKSRLEVLNFYPNNSNHISEILDNLHYIYILLLKTNSAVPQNSQRVLPKHKDLGQCYERKHNSFWGHIKTAIRLHKNPIFLLVSLCRTVHFLTFVPLVTVIVDFAMDKGLLEEDGKYVIAALSAGDLLGRLCLGWITDRGYITSSRYMLIVMVLQGASTSSLAFMESKAMLMTMIAVLGLLQGSLFVRHPVLMSMYLGKNEQSVGMGCMNFMSGLLGFALPSYIGYFRDTIGSYNGMYYISGGIGTFIGLMWIFEPFFNTCMKLDLERSKQQSA